MAEYCMDCDHYIPGGKERNCNLILPYSKGAVSALNEANMNKVYAYMSKLTNSKTRSEDVNFCLDPEDIKHYKVVV